MGCSQSRRNFKFEPKRLRTESEQAQPDSKDRNSHPEVVRAVLLGNSSVGKSSISVRYFNDSYAEMYDVTLGGVFFKKNIQLTKDLNVCLQMWDTGGEQKYRSMAPLYYRNASIAFLVCSLTDKNPIQSLQYWLDELSQKLQKQKITIAVLANKSDLGRNDESLTIKEWCDRSDIRYFQCSARTGEGVCDAFNQTLNISLSKIRRRE